MAVIPLYKPLGWTPLRAMETLRQQRPDLVSSSMTYAGRLDPMAEGVVLILTDDDRLQAKDYQRVEKVYVATIAFGVVSDTYDALGLVRRGGDVDEEAIATALSALPGMHRLPFPAYSSYKVKGKSLHWWAQQGRLGEVSIPTKEMRVLAMYNVQVRHVAAETVLHDVVRRINLVRGDFRQQRCQESWHHALRGIDTLVTTTFTLEVTSGTYIRSLAQELGERLGCGALLLSLLRTRVGTYDVDKAIRLSDE